MAQITLTLDLTGKNAETLLTLAKMLSGEAAPITGAPEQMKLEDISETEEKPTAKTAAKSTKPASNKKAEEKIGEQEINLTDVRAVALKLSNGGKKEALQEVFAKYGAKKLSDISQADYPALIADLEEAANG